MNTKLRNNPVGEGAFGIVYKAREKNTGNIRAVKQIKLEKIVDYDGFMNEVEALKILDHPNIIKLHSI